MFHFVYIAFPWSALLWIGAADLVVKFSLPECHFEETIDPLNASFMLKPTFTRRDFSDVLELSVNGTISTMRLELGRYEGNLVVF